MGALLEFGGFPAPLLAGDARTWRRWQRERLSRVVHDDLRDLESIRQVALVELLVEALPSRVGSPLSIRNLAQDMQVAHATAERWLGILENLYVCFRIPPFSAPRIRAVRKENKLYLWDWSQTPDAGPRFENLVACQLLKYWHHREDTQGHRMELRFLRDTYRREVDFVVIEDGAPSFAVECKAGERAAGPAIAYFRERTPIRDFHPVHLGETDKQVGGTRVLLFRVFCEELAMP